MSLGTGGCTLLSFLSGSSIFNTDLIGEICSFLTVRKINELMLVNWKLFRLLSSDEIYWKIFKREIETSCNCSKKPFFDPEFSIIDTSVHPLYGKYRNVSSNFRFNLIAFKKEVSQNRQQYTFKTLNQICNTTKVKLYKKESLYLYSVKSILIGDGAVGKTSFIHRAAYGRFDGSDYWMGCYDNPLISY